MRNRTLFYLVILLIALTMALASVAQGNIPENVAAKSVITSEPEVRVEYVYVYLSCPLSASPAEWHQKMMVHYHMRNIPDFSDSAPVIFNVTPYPKNPKGNNPQPTQTASTVTVPTVTSTPDPTEVPTEIPPCESGCVPDDKVHDVPGVPHPETDKELPDTRVICTETPEPEFVK